MKFIVDMNLEPNWVVVLRENGFEAEHWSDIGSPTATDEEIISLAGRERAVVLTQDLDFGTLLAHLRLNMPSVVLLRTRNARPSRTAAELTWLLRRYLADLEDGVLLVVDPDRHRIRRLPLRR